MAGDEKGSEPLPELELDWTKSDEEPPYHPRPRTWAEQVYDEGFSWRKILGYGCGCLVLFIVVMSVLAMLGFSLSLPLGG